MCNFWHIIILALKKNCYVIKWNLLP
jgi:hypothetical protein